MINVKALVDAIFKTVHDYVAPAFKEMESRVAGLTATQLDLKVRLEKQAQQLSALQKQMAALERKSK